MNMKIAADNFILLRKGRSLTQDEFADVLGISRQAISKWETGQSLPDIDMLIKISNMFEVTMNDLVERPLKSIVKDFEGIISVEPDVAINAMKTFSDNDIVIATKGCSPTLCEYISRLYPRIDFEKQRVQIGNIRITIIEDIHAAILERVNLEVISMFNRNRSGNVNP